MGSTRTGDQQDGDQQDGDQQDGFTSFLTGPTVPPLRLLGLFRITSRRSCASSWFLLAAPPVIDPDLSLHLTADPTSIGLQRQLALISASLTNCTSLLAEARQAGKRNKTEKIQLLIDCPED